MFNDDLTEEEMYCREISRLYWIEEDEMKLGIHPSQVKERIEKELNLIDKAYEKITFLDWIENSQVKVSLDGVYFGIFDYAENHFNLIAVGL